LLLFMLGLSRTMGFKRPLKAFFSYSHKDRRYVDYLVDSLAAFRLNGDVDDWDDRKIRGGQQWEDVLIERARKSQLFLLLVTNRFVGSKYSVGTELTIARALYARQQAGIAPVQVEECNWEIDGLMDLQLIRPFDKPVSSSRRDRAWTEVGRAVKKIADDLLDNKYFPATNPKSREVPILLPHSIGRDGEDEEEKRFQGAVASAVKEKPFVCILTGSRQGQSEFIDRLAAEGGPIRRSLGSNSAYNPLTIMENSWIRSGEPPESMLDGVLAPFVDTTFASAERKVIGASFASHPGPTLVRFELTLPEWEACRQSRLDDFLKYWDGWPPLAPDRPVFVFLAIKADIGKLGVSGGYWLPLDSIAFSTVQAWLGKPEISSQYLTAQIETKLPAVFGDSDRIRMEDLAEKLLPLLRKYQI
jgi:hypothetical protein